jgi:hypothetical protein
MFVYIILIKMAYVNLMKEIKDLKNKIWIDNFWKVEISKLWFTLKHIDIHITIRGSLASLFLKPLNYNGSAFDVHFVIAQCSLDLILYFQSAKENGCWRRTLIFKSIFKLVSH